MDLVTLSATTSFIDSLSSVKPTSDDEVESAPDRRVKTGGGYDNDVMPRSSVFVDAGVIQRLNDVQNRMTAMLGGKMKKKSDPKLDPKLDPKSEITSVVSSVSFQTASTSTEPTASTSIEPSASTDIESSVSFEEDQKGGIKKRKKNSSIKKPSKRKHVKVIIDTQNPYNLSSSNLFTNTD
jgi:hypothetical protein